MYLHDILSILNHVLFFFYPSIVFLKDPGRFYVSVPVPLNAAVTMNCSVQNRSKTTVRWFKMKGKRGEKIFVPAAPDKDDAFVKKFRSLQKSAQYLCNVSNTFGHKTRKFILKVFCK